MNEIFTLELFIGTGLTAFAFVLGKIFSPILDALGSRLAEFVLKIWERKQISRALCVEFEDLIRRNHASNGHNRFRARKTYLHDQNILSFLSKHDIFMRRAIKNVWIENEILSYDDSDVFFAGMELLFDKLNKDDLRKVFERHRNNNQATLWVFFEYVEERKPKLLSLEMVQYLRESQEDWNATSVETTQTV